MLISSSLSAGPITGWTDLLLVGNDMIDADHRHLFTLATRIHEGMLVQNGGDQLRTVIDELMAYAREHFAREEALMKKIRFPELQEHAFEHRMLNYHLRNLHYRYASGERYLTTEVEIFLDRWLARHILTADLKLAESLRTSPHSGDAA